MESLTIHALVYVLKCAEDKIYVGKTHNLNLRLSLHWSGQGAKWTRLYPPKKLLRVILDETEEKVTQDYICLFGAKNVRGGSWTKCP